MSQLEWKAQTAPFSKEEEKRLMAKIRNLESKVVSYKKVQRLSQDVDTNRMEADEIHARIQEIAQSSQKHHEEIVRLGSKFQELRDKVESQQLKLDEVRGRVREVSQKYFSMVTMSRESDKIVRAKKEKVHKETLKESAKKKLSQGEKVSLQELSALYEDEGETEKE